MLSNCVTYDRTIENLMLVWRRPTALFRQVCAYYHKNNIFMNFDFKNNSSRMNYFRLILHVVICNKYFQRNQMFEKFRKILRVIEMKTKKTTRKSF